MRIAVSYEQSSGNIFFHFGETPAFKIYDINNGKVTNTWLLSSGSVSHGALVILLKENKVDVLICGRIGQGARNKLDAAGIAFYGGAEGNADEAVQAYLDGALTYSADNSTHGMLS